MFYWAKKNVKIGHFHLEIANETEDQKSKDIEINQINKKQTKMTPKNNIKMKYTIIECCIK